MESLVLASCSASPRLLLSAARGRRPSSQLLPAPWPVAAAAGRREARRPKLVVAVAAQGSKNGEGAACPVASVIARKRKTDAAPRLDEADRTLYSTFCGAANSLSQLYTQAMAQQKLSFQAGERHALAGSGAGTMLSAVHGFNTGFLSSRSM